MSLDLDVSATIDRPIDEVFEFVSTVENNAKWESRMVESPRPDEEMDVGTTWKAVVEGLLGNSEMTMQCTVYDPPRRFGYTTPEGMMGGRLKTEEAVYTFSEEGDATRLDWEGTIKLKGILRLLQPLIARMIRADLETSLENLKSELEPESDYD